MHLRFWRSLVLGLSVAFAGLGPAAVAHAQSARVGGGAGDPVRVSPEHYRVLLENDYVRVLDARWQPGEVDNSHAHPTNAYFVLSGESMRFQLDKSAEDADVRPGSVTLQGPLDPVAIENTGESPLHLIMVERRENDLARSSGEDAVDASGDIYRVVDENDDFRVLDVTLEPGQKDNPHRHPSSVIYALGPAAGTWHKGDGQTESQVFRPGSALFLEATDSISLENTGSRNIRLIVFELKR